MLKKIVVLPLLVLALSGCSGDFIVSPSGQEAISKCWATGMRADVGYKATIPQETYVECVPAGQLTN